MATISCQTCGQVVNREDLNLHIRETHMASFGQPIHHGQLTQYPSSFPPPPSYPGGNQFAPLLYQIPPRSTQFTSWQQNNTLLPANNTSIAQIASDPYNEDVRLLQSLQESNQMLSEKTRSDIVQKIVIGVYENASLSVRDKSTCVSYVRSMKMYASLIANIFTHVTLCTPKTSSFIAELQDMLKIWKTWDNLTSLINHGKMKAALRELYERSQVVSKGHQCNVTLNHPLEVPDEDVEYVSALLATILTNDEDVQKFYSCTNDDAQSLIDLVQALLDAHNVDIHAIFKRVLLHALIRLSRKSGHYPGGMALRELQYSGAPITGGGFGDIYKGSVLERAVAVKVLRTFGTEQELLKSLSCEVVVWRNTKHPNLLPFYGVFRQENLSAICLVSPWMDNGTVTNYVRNHDNVDYFSLIMDIAKGLQYLHGMLPTIVHGDIKGANIFVSPLGRACLADFGLAAVNDILLKLPSTTRHLGLSVRYSAPEILRASQAMDGKPTRATTMSDIYSFACVCYEIYSKLEPFGNSDSNQTSIAVLQGRRPSRPNSQQLDDALWQYIEKCWHQESKARPTAEAVVSYLSSRRPANGALEPHPDKEWDDDFRVQITYPLAQHPFHFLAN